MKSQKNLSNFFQNEKNFSHFKNEKFFFLSWKKKLKRYLNLNVFIT